MKRTTTVGATTMLLTACLGQAIAAPPHPYLNDANAIPGSTLSNDRFPLIALTELKGGVSAGAERLSKYDVVGPKAYGATEMLKTQRINGDVKYHYAFSPRAYQGYLQRRPCDQAMGIPFNSTGPASQGCTMFAGHFLYYAGTKLARDVTAGSTTLLVQDASKLKVGRYIVVYDPPANSFNNAEHMKVTAINRSVSPHRVTVQSRGYKSVARSHPQGAIVAEHETGNGGDPRNWGYNLSVGAPADANGKTMGRYMADWLAANIYRDGSGKLISGLKVDGIYFDVDNYWIQSGGWDVNNDLVADNGRGANGRNLWGEGLLDFYRMIRARLPDHRIIGGARRARGFEDLNGIQLEGWPVRGNYSSPTPRYDGSDGFDAVLQRFTVHMRYHEGGDPYMEALSKAPTKLYPNGRTGLTSNAAFRFSFGSALLEDGHYAMENSQKHPDVWWDEYAVDVAPGSPTYGHAIKSNPRDESLIRAHKGWLGRPLEYRQRIYDSAQFAPQNSLISNGGVEGGTSGWSARNVNISRDATSSAEGAASLRATGHIRYDAKEGGTFVEGPSFRVDKGKDYTFAFAAKSSQMRDLNVRVANSSANLLLPDQWTRVVMTFTANSTGQFRPRFNIGQESTVTWFDAMYLFEGNANVFSREFENGIVVVNATSKWETIDLGESFRRIKGTGQDPVNDGSIVSSVRLPPYDAAVLVRMSPGAAPSPTPPPSDDPTPPAPDGGSGGFACGAPNIDLSAGPGVYVWRSCSGDQWSFRMVSGNGVRDFRGRLIAGQALGSPIRRYLERNDVVNKQRSDLITYDLKLWEPARQDGFDVDVSNSGWACFRVESSSNVTIYLGPDKKRLTDGSVNRNGVTCGT
ncbi:MAG: carbohydrate binding domain-containing protein [Thiohalocapsa sp.]|nr:carbohydrate binding domain-containing protein [Thiohalocapsa sp.]